MRRAFVLAMLASHCAAAEPARGVDAILADHAIAIGKAESVHTLAARSRMEVGDSKAGDVISYWRAGGDCVRRFAAGPGRPARSEHFVERGAYIASWTLKRFRPDEVTTRAGWYLFRALAEPFPLLPYARNRAAQEGLRVAVAPGDRFEAIYTAPDAEGVYTVFLIDSRTHLLKNIRFEERANESFVNITFDDYRDVGGVMLPHTVYALWRMPIEREDRRGFEWKKHQRIERVEEWTLNPPLDEVVFEPPGIGRGGGRGFERLVLESGPAPQEVGAGDLDGDGRADVVAACSGGISVRFGGADGQPLFVPLGAGRHRGMVIEDLDRDGRLEVLTASWVDPALHYFIVEFDSGRRPLPLRKLQVAPLFAYDVICRDLDRDGLGDLIASGWGGRSLEIKFNNGAGGVRTAGSIWPIAATKETAERRAFGLDVGQVDAGNLKDIALADGRRVVIFLGQENGSFQPRISLEFPEEAGVGLIADVALTDLDLDGRDDLLVLNTDPAGDPRFDLIVVRNEDNALRPHARIPCAARGEDVAVGHFNGDEFPDAVVSSYLSGEITVLLGDGKGNLGRAQRFVSGRGANRLAVVDYDGDGRDDIIVSNAVDDTVAVFLNRREASKARRIPPPRAVQCASTGGIEFALKGLSDPYEFVAEFRIPVSIRDPSGIAALGADDAQTQFALVSDKDAAIYRATLDRGRRRLLVGQRIPIEGLQGERLDLEGVAYDHKSGTLFVGCEADSSVLRLSLFGHRFGRAGTPIAVSGNDGIEGVALRRKRDGAPLLYVFKEREGTTLKQPPVHVFRLAENPFRLLPTGEPLLLPVYVPDQTGATVPFEEQRLLVVSRLTRSILEFQFEGDGFAERTRRANFAGLTERRLGLLNPLQPLFGAAEGLAIDGGGDLFLLIDNNGAVIGKKGLNRGPEGRLLWFRNRGASRKGGEPKRVEVRQILIPWTGSRNSPVGIVRTREEARRLATECTARARKGEDFDALTTEYGDPASKLPHLLRVVNDHVPPGRGERRRGTLPRALSRLIFGLEVGESGLCEYEAEESPYGWHVVKRLK